MSKGGYKNVVGLTTSIGKDIIPRVAGSYSSQPISDIIEITVFYVQHRVRIHMSDRLTQGMP